MNEKRKRSDRLHRSKVAAQRQRKIAKTFNLPEKPLNRYTKRHAMNCGNSNCVLCMNPRKAFNEPTFQEKKENERQKIDSRSQ